jgi:glycogen synthase
MAEPPLRVLMTTDAVGGVWTYGLDLAAALQDHDVSVAMAVLGPPPSAGQRAHAASLRNLTLYHHDGSLEWMDEPWGGVDRAGAFLRELSTELRPDVVHLNGYCHGDLELGAPKLVVGHSCVLSWWRAVHASAAPPRYAQYRSRVRKGLQGADMVVAPSRHMLRALQHHYGHIARCRVILNGRDAGLRARSKQPIVLCAARLWDPGKNVETLARAAQGLSWPVCVAGPGAQELPHVRQLGLLEAHELADWYERASVYALPARYEPFGLSVLEAALAGCALVLGDIPSLREIWGNAACFVEPDDDERLRCELERLIADDHARRELGRRARSRALGMSSSVMAADYMRVYRALCRERSNTATNSPRAQLTT